MSAGRIGVPYCVIEILAPSPAFRVHNIAGMGDGERDVSEELCTAMQIIDHLSDMDVCETEIGT